MGTAHQETWPAAAAGGYFSLPGSASVASGPQRQPGDLPLPVGFGDAGASEPAVAEPGASPDAAASGGLTLVPGADGTAVITGSDAPGTGPLSSVPVLVAVADGTSAAAPAAGGELASLLHNAERLAEMCEERPVVLDDPTTIDELAIKAYPRMRRMLQAELLVDRERAGLLTDFS
jgi:hypothetical protein